MAFDVFLKLEGIKGEAQDQVYKDEIDILSWSWGASQSGTTHMGKGSGGGKVSVQDMHLHKIVDKATPTLFKLCATGQHIPKGKLIVRKAGGDKPVEYLTIELEKILVSHIHFGGGTALERVNEDFALNFAKYHIKYTQQDEKGGKGSEVEHKFDIAQNAVA